MRIFFKYELRYFRGNLQKNDEYPPHDDPYGRNMLLFNDNAGLVQFEAIVSTTPDQIAIAPGYIQKTREKDG